MPLIFLFSWLMITLLWWGLALAPLPAAAPAWLLVARQVCFGMTATGLPEGYGWLGLFAVPGLMLGFFLVVWGKELRRDLLAIRHTWTGEIVGGLLITVPVLGMLWVGQRVFTALQWQTAWTQPQPTTPFPQDWPRLDRAAPDFILLDQDGKETSLLAQRGKIIVLTFAFGHCTTLCPTVVHTARAALTAFPDVSLWVVTLDPWRDTPGALAGIATHWQLTGEHRRVLSADVATVLAVLDAYNIPHQRDVQNGDISHPALVYIIDAAGRIAYGLSNPSQVWLRGAVQRLAQGAVS